MDFTQSMDNGYMIPSSIAVGSGEATDIRCVCDTVEDFKTFLDATDMELRYEGLVTYEKTSKTLKFYKGDDIWDTLKTEVDLDICIAELNNKYIYLDGKITDLSAEIKNIKGQIQDSVNGSIPNGTIGIEKLNDDLKSLFITDEGFDNDSSETYGNIVVSTSSIQIDENANALFTVKLDTAPTNNQVVNLLVNNNYCIIDKTSLIFTPSNYLTPQTVAVSGVHDSTSYIDKSSIITLSSSNVLNKNISVIINNIDEVPSDNIAVQSVTLDKITHTMKVDEIVQLTATISPSDATNKSVIWEANNNNCSVVDGLVTANSPGECIISCKTVDGNKIAMCTITVEAKNPEQTNSKIMRVTKSRNGGTFYLGIIVPCLNVKKDSTITLEYDFSNMENFQNGGGTSTFYGSANGATDVNEFAPEYGSYITNDIQIIDGNAQGILERVFNKDATTPYCKFILPMKKKDGTIPSCVINKLEVKINGSVVDIFALCGLYGETETVEVGNLSTYSMRTISTKECFLNGEKVKVNDTLLPQLLSRWVGKKWACIGDSLTEAHSSNTVKKYHDYINELIGVNNINYGISGSGFISTTHRPILGRIDSMESDVDLVTVFAGVNDYQYAGKQLGELGDTTNDTVYGSIYSVVQSLLNKYPTKTLAFITPIPKEDCYPANEKQNTSGFSIGDVAKAVIETCKLYSIPVLDLYHQSNLYPWLPASKSAYFKNDGLHPTEKGQEVIAHKILAFINSL